MLWRRALDLAQGLSVSIFPPSRMHRALQPLLVWFALVVWIAGWNVHAAMVLAQAAGQAQLCTSHGGSAPGAPLHSKRGECACCAQALAATTPTAEDPGGARLLPVSGERIPALRRVVFVWARRDLGGKPRAPPVA